MPLGKRHSATHAHARASDIADIKHMPSRPRLKQMPSGNNSSSKRQSRPKRKRGSITTIDDPAEMAPNSNSSSNSSSSNSSSNNPDAELTDSPTPESRPPPVKRRRRSAQLAKSVIVINSSDEEDETDNETNKLFHDSVPRTEIVDFTEPRNDQSHGNSHSNSNSNSHNNSHTGGAVANQKPANHRSLQYYQCPICFDSPDKTIALPCGHCYCFDCLFQAFSHSRTARKTDAVCALCRSTYTLRQTTTLKFKVKT